MKQKYTLTIADMRLNVITEEPRESVDKIVGILDRKMREITLKSKKCPKSEAALLCALECCADKLAMKTELEEVTSRAENAEAEIARLEEEIAKLRAKFAIGVEAKESAPAVEGDKVDSAPEQLVIEEPAADKAPAKKKQSRNKVGSMFDLLTFSDI